MSETPERKPGEDTPPPTLSGRQKGLLFGAVMFVFLSVKLLQHVLVPAECRISGWLIFVYVGMPMFFGGIVLLSAWSGGGDRRLLLRESGLFLAVVFANLFLLNLMECYFEGAWYGFIVHLPVLMGAFYFLASRLTRIAETIGGKP